MTAPAPSVRRRVLVAEPSCDLELVRAELAGLRVEIEASAELAGDDVVAVVVGVEQPAQERDLERLPSLRVIASCSTGVDHIDVDAAARRGNRRLGMIGAREIAAMKPGAVLVNVARAEIVDQQALVRALADEHLAGAALDVLEVEPPTADDPAPPAPNLIVTPHAAWYSRESEREATVRAARAVAAVLSAAAGTPGREKEAV